MAIIYSSFSSFSLSDSLTTFSKKGLPLMDQWVFPGTTNELLTSHIASNSLFVLWCIGMIVLDSLRKHKHITSNLTGLTISTVDQGSKKILTEIIMFVWLRTGCNECIVNKLYP